MVCHTHRTGHVHHVIKSRRQEAPLFIVTLCVLQYGGWRTRRATTNRPHLIQCDSRRPLREQNISWSVLSLTTNTPLTRDPSELCLPFLSMGMEARRLKTPAFNQNQSYFKTKNEIRSLTDVVINHSRMERVTQICTSIRADW